MTLSLRALPFGIGFASLLAACSSSSSPSAPTVTGYTITTASGGALTATAGDALQLKVMQTTSDGTTEALPAGATVTWTSPTVATALSADSTADSPLPAAGAQPTGTFLANPLRTDRTDLTGVLFVLDAGKMGGALSVTATIAGTGISGNATGTVTVSATPAGDATAGKAIYIATCADCHGTTGHGTAVVAGDGGTTFSIAGQTYPYPAPGLNAEDGNCASDPDWNPAIFAFAARADVDNGGLTLRVPMPNWLSESGSTGKPLTTQNFADIFAYLKTQTQ